MTATGHGLRIFGGAIFLMAAVLVHGSCLNWGVREPDGDTDGDADVDADGDTDGDADVDADGDTDADADADSDVVTVGDADTDTDTDADVDSDADADEHLDGNADGDLDGDADASACGDGSCSGDEDASACPVDCSSVCGDGFCTHLENAYACGDATACPEDCLGSGIWVRICDGTFTMGSPLGELGRESDETQHVVTLTGGFMILSSEVTQGEFESLMGYNPSFFTECGTECPVESVSWHEAAEYCNELSSREGLGTCYSCSGSGRSVSCTERAEYSSPYDCPGYRLPTEAEWEYAARASTTTASYAGNLDVDDCSSSVVLDPVAWYCGNAGDAPRDVGTRAPNAWGLYDMLGNVWEWCHDWYARYPEGASTDPWGMIVTGNRVGRGGSWEDFAGSTRTANRARAGPRSVVDHCGLRPVRSIDH